MKRRNLGLLVFVILVLVGVAFVMIESSKVRASPETIYVDDDGSQPYLRIKNAVYFAEDGDTVYVYNGTYKNENIKIDKEIDLIGENRFYTTIQGGSPITVEGNNAYVYNFSIIYNKDAPYDRGGEAINVEGNNNVFDHCIIQYYHDGIELRAASNNIIKNCVIRDCFWGIVLRSDTYYNYAEHNHIHHNNFINNAAHVSPYDFLNEDVRQYWNTSNEGNYWDDYTGPDANRDGIGEIPYTIDKDTKDIDYYPFYNPINLGVPNENDSKENQEDEGIPGFGLALLVMAIAAILLLKRRKRGR